MSKRFLLMLLLVWNVLLTAGLIWSHTRTGVAKRAVKGLEARIGEEAEAGIPLPAIARDSAGLAEGRIAFFYMDSISAQYELVKEIQEKVRTEGSRMENSLRNELQRAETEARELANKDHTYSTQAEMEADQRRFQELQMKLQEQQARSQDKLDRLQMDALQKITGELQDFLTLYNAQAGFDYIFSVQPDGQIWVGNKGLDITNDLVQGLNTKHRASKGSK